MRRAFPLIIFLMVSFIGSYTVFTFYKPKMLTELSRIKGYSTQRSQIIPYPSGSKELGKDESLEGKRITLQTTKTPEEIRAFYINVYTVRGWRLTSEGEQDVAFAKDGRSILISTSTNEDQNDTIVVIDQKND